MLKLTRIYTALELTEDIKNQIIEQNKWMRDLAFNIDRIYRMNINGITYRNTIISTSLETQMLNKGHIIFGLIMCFLHEHVDISQYKNCFRLGHIKRKL